MNYIDLLKKEKIHIDDLIIKTINLKNNILNIINIETITSSNIINNFLLKNSFYLNKLDYNQLFNYILNYLPNNIILKNYKEILRYLYNGYTIIIINNKKIIAIETKNNLSRGVSEINYEKTIIGPKDSFIEHFNINLGLIRKRIKSNELSTISYEIGKYTKTKIGIIYINNIAKKETANKIKNKIKKINIDGIIDSNYLKRYLNSNNLFPTIKSTERPDLTCQSLLEGKIAIIVDNSPEILILPTFFIDFFHTSDDYYQKKINISFIRLIRLLAFLISIFLPAIYISLTTYNPDSMSLNLLISFQSQRQNVPFPSFIEAIMMIISFEILRETDIRIPSSMGSAISILGGLVLGEALVNANIVSPIMIIVVSLSAISGMTNSSIEIINAIRWYRFILIILASIFGFYGIFLGIILILNTLANIKTLDLDYLYPFAPINIKEQKDGFFRLNNNNRNPLLSNNKKRGN